MRPVGLARVFLQFVSSTRVLALSTTRRTNSESFEAVALQVTVLAPGAVICCLVRSSAYARTNPVLIAASLTWIVAGAALDRTTIRRLLIRNRRGRLVAPGLEYSRYAVARLHDPFGVEVICVT